MKTIPAVAKAYRKTLSEITCMTIRFAEHEQPKCREIGPVTRADRSNYRGFR